MPRLKTLGTRVAVLAQNRCAPQYEATDGRKLSPSRRGYDRRWEKTRDAFLRAHPLCQCPDCGEGRKRVTVATVVDHVIPHRGNTILFNDPLNLQSLAKRCHDKKTWRETLGNGMQEREFQERRMPSDLAPSRIPCVMVCGPPNGGKHPYVRAHAGPNDVVIDMDAIMRKVSGQDAWAFEVAYLPEALTERNRQLYALARDSTHDRAWFTINAPDPRERALWARRLGATVVMLAPPLAECIRRIEAEPYHAGYTERMIEAAKDWWAQNEALRF